MLRVRRWLPLTLCLGFSWSGTTFAEKGTPDDGVFRQATWLKEKGKTDEAKELLERWAEQHPDSERVAIARADLYLAEDNPFWALKVLTEVVNLRPASCEAKTFIARIQLQQANLEQAEAQLNDTICDTPETLKVRRLLLRAELAELRNRGDVARRLVKEAESHTYRYEEDDRRLAQLERAYEPYRLPLWNFELDAGAGYASTGYGQVPLEVAATQKNQGSAILNLSLRGRVVLPYRRAFRPLAEIEYRDTEQVTSRSRNFSVKNPAFRVGALFGQGYPRLQLNYAFDFVDFDGQPKNGSSSGKWFSQGHRGEYRLDLGNGYVGFGGVGYRDFADNRMSRFESEHGVLKAWTLSETLGVSSGATLRGYRAERRAFDQFGGSLFAGFAVQAPMGFTLLESLTVSHDHFPASKYYFTPTSDNRDELTVKVQASLLSKEFAGARLGLDYTYVNRNSNVGLYDFTDHRVFLQVHYRLSHDEARAKRISGEGRIVMRHEKEIPKTAEPESRSVRDALKQDEELRRGSSCLK
jgi:tetratricopeptide (TPR) repeat protein